MPSDFELGESTITGKYVRQFEGVNVFETKKFGSLITPSPDGYLHYRAVTIPERGIIAAESVFTSGLKDGTAMMQHEFGHILQYRGVPVYSVSSIFRPQLNHHHIINFGQKRGLTICLKDILEMLG